jgi:hypothetical protein
MKASASAAVPDRGSHATRPQQALARLLDDLGSVLLPMSRATYCVKPLPGVSGSIGEHARHILDHVAALVSARPYGVLTYDRRERGTLVETDPGAALRAILRLKTAITDVDDEALESPVAVMTTVERGEPSVVAWSTLQREMVFVASHTVHHHALIATLLAISGDEVPDGLGMAPSTPRLVRS